MLMSDVVSDFVQFTGWGLGSSHLYLRRDLRWSIFLLNTLVDFFLCTYVPTRFLILFTTLGSDGQIVVEKV